MAQANPLEQRLGALARLGDGGAANQQRHAHVLQGGELRQQVVKLIDKTQCAVAQQTTGTFTQGRQLFTSQPHAAFGGRVEAAEQVEQGTLA
ncbi:hypothetical protein D3C77_616170 [compost metagenome]